MATRYTTFFLALHKKNFEEAYAITSPGYREENSLKEFEERFRDRGCQWAALDHKSVVKVSWIRKTATVCPSTEGLLIAGPCYELVKFADEWWMTGEISSWSLD